MTDKATISRWYDDGAAKGATHMIVVTDTFANPWEDFPVYVMPGEIAEEIAGMHSMPDSMQRITEVYNYTLDKDEQMGEHRAIHY